MTQEYVQPGYGLDGFNCPHCNAYAHQCWRYHLEASKNPSGTGESNHMVRFAASFCARCGGYTIWKDEILIFPQVHTTPLPARDMPEDVKGDYDEARAIFSHSPRGAAALLRLAIQKLVVSLGEKGDDLNTSIGRLVKRGLRVEVQKALDVVRVIGNNAVHPGVIDVRDNPKIAADLFKLTNMIVEQLITQPKEVDELYSNLPETARKAISDRDK